MRKLIDNDGRRLSSDFRHFPGFMLNKRKSTAKDSAKCAGLPALPVDGGEISER